MEERKIECSGCHRVLFSYEEGDEIFDFQCPMCNEKGSVNASKIIYDEFLVDPSVKGKGAKPLEKAVPPPTEKQEEPTTERPRISININVEPEGSLPKIHEFVLAKLIQDTLGFFGFLVESNQVEKMAQNIQEIDKQRKSGIVSPGGPLPEMPGGQMPGAGFPK